MRKGLRLGVKGNNRNKQGLGNLGGRLTNRREGGRVQMGMKRGLRRFERKTFNGNVRRNVQRGGRNDNFGSRYRRGNRFY